MQARDTRSTHQFVNKADAANSSAKCQAVNDHSQADEGEGSTLDFVQLGQVMGGCATPCKGAVLHEGSDEPFVRREPARDVENPACLAQEA